MVTATGQHDHTTDWHCCELLAPSDATTAISVDLLCFTGVTKGRGQAEINSTNNTNSTTSTTSTNGTNTAGCSTAKLQHALPVTRAGRSSSHSSTTLFPSLGQNALPATPARRSSRHSSRTLFQALQHDALPVSRLGRSSRPYNLFLSFATAPSINLTECCAVPQHHQHHCYGDSCGTALISISNSIHSSFWHMPLCSINIFFLIFLQNNDLNKKVRSERILLSYFLHVGWPCFIVP